MGSSKSKKARLKAVLPYLDGLSLQEVSDRLGLSQTTIENYFYELGGTAAWLERGKIRVNNALVAGATQEGGHHQVHARPASSVGGQSHRLGEPWITNGGLNQGETNTGLDLWVMKMNILTLNMDGLSKEGDKEILQRIMREGTVGSGERLG